MWEADFVYFPKKEQFFSEEDCSGLVRPCCVEWECFQHLILKARIAINFSSEIVSFTFMEQPLFCRCSNKMRMETKKHNCTCRMKQSKMNVNHKHFHFSTFGAGREKQFEPEGVGWKFSYQFGSQGSEIAWSHFSQQFNLQTKTFLLSKLVSNGRNFNLRQ